MNTVLDQCFAERGGCCKLNTYYQVDAWLFRQTLLFSATLPKSLVEFAQAGKVDKRYLIHLLDVSYTESLILVVCGM